MKTVFVHMLWSWNREADKPVSDDLHRVIRGAEEVEVKRERLGKGAIVHVMVPVVYQRPGRRDVDPVERDSRIRSVGVGPRVA